MERIRHFLDVMKRRLKREPEIRLVWAPQMIVCPNEVIAGRIRRQAGSSAYVRVVSPQLTQIYGGTAPKIITVLPGVDLDGSFPEGPDLRTILRSGQRVHDRDAVFIQL